VLVLETLTLDLPIVSPQTAIAVASDIVKVCTQQLGPIILQTVYCVIQFQFQENEPSFGELFRLIFMIID